MLGKLVNDNDSPTPIKAMFGRFLTKPDLKRGRLRSLRFAQIILYQHKMKCHEFLISFDTSPFSSWSRPETGPNFLGTPETTLDGPINTSLVDRFASNRTWHMCDLGARDRGTRVKNGGLTWGSTELLPPGQAIKPNWGRNTWFNSWNHVSPWHISRFTLFDHVSP